MTKPEDLEIWAMQTAEQIVLKEGVNLMLAAQWLDKKQTVKSSTQLRNAICRSLLEAIALSDRPAIAGPDGARSLT